MMSVSWNEVDKPVRCRFGLHAYMDLLREDRQYGQFAREECVRCGAFRQVVRIIFRKTKAPMHPRVRGK